MADRAVKERQGARFKEVQKITTRRMNISFMYMLYRHTASMHLLVMARIMNETPLARGMGSCARACV